jgi:hypothetical protein
LILKAFTELVLQNKLPEGEHALRFGTRRAGVVDNGTMVAVESTRVKILGETTAVMCDVMNCECPAKFLFRTGAGRIRAYCSDHAAIAASELSVDLPDPATPSHGA